MAFTNHGLRDLNSFLIKRESTPGNVGPGAYSPGKDLSEVMAERVKVRNPSKAFRNPLEPAKKESKEESKAK